MIQNCKKIKINITLLNPIKVPNRENYNYITDITFVFF